MADLKTSVVINLSGDLQQQARRMGSSLQRLGQLGNAAFRGMGSSIGTTLRGLTRFGTSAAGLVTGAGLVASSLAAARSFMKIEERIVRLGVDADVSEEKVKGLWKQIQRTAALDDINIDPKRLLAAIEEVVERTGDLGFASANLRVLGQAIQATGDEGSAIGALAAEFQKMGLSAKETSQAFDILFALGRAGAFTLKDLASLGPRLAAAYSATGRTGVGAVRELAAAVQLVRQGTGNAEQATTAVEALLRTLQDADKIEIFREGGIQIWDPEQEALGKKVMRPINELMVEIIKRAQGDPEVLSRIFDAEALRAMNAALAEFQRTGAIESLERLMSLDVAGTVAEASGRLARTASAEIEDAFSQIRSTLEETFAGPAKTFAEALNKAVQSEAFQALLKGDFGKVRAEIIGAVKQLTIGEIDAGKMILELFEWKTPTIDEQLKRLEVPIPPGTAPPNTPEGQAARLRLLERHLMTADPTRALIPFGEWLKGLIEDWKSMFQAPGTEPPPAAPESRPAPPVRESQSVPESSGAGTAPGRSGAAPPPTAPAPPSPPPAAPAPPPPSRKAAPSFRESQGVPPQSSLGLGSEAVGRLVIEFRNAPPGLRVRELKSRGFEIDVDTGPIMLGIG